MPEEINRLLTDQIADLLFTPSPDADLNLLREGVDPQSVLVTGNTVIDALLTEVQRQTEDGELRAGLDLELAKHLRNAGANSVSEIKDRPFVLVTGHRRESFGGGFERICDALACLARRFPDHRIIYPVHLNPNVRDVVHRRLHGLENLLLLPPVSYRLFVRLLSTCRVVLTDSGGVQEEGPSLGKPVLVMRDNTERPEGIEAGTAKLVGTNPERIVAEVSRLLEDPLAYAAMAERQNPYGDGRASQRIAEAIRTRIRPRHDP